MTTGHIRIWKPRFARSAHPGIIQNGQRLSVCNVLPAGTPTRIAEQYAFSVLLVQFHRLAALASTVLLESTQRMEMTAATTVPRANTQHFHSKHNVPSVPPAMRSQIQGGPNVTFVQWQRGLAPSLEPKIVQIVPPGGTRTVGRRPAKTARPALMVHRMMLMMENARSVQLGTSPRREAMQIVRDVRLATLQERRERRIAVCVRTGK